jgi:hypothetical protein
MISGMISMEGHSKKRAAHGACWVKPEGDLSMSRILVGIALGAGGAFLLDPQQGSRRRALLRDKMLLARVRTRLRRYVSHPHAIRVSAANGCVALGGDILASEHGALLSALRSMSGVRDCADRLDVHPDAEGIPAQRPTRSPGTAARWVGGVGALLAVYALARAKVNRPLLQGRVVHRQPKGHSAVSR